jgi:hypothetical protein
MVVDEAAGIPLVLQAGSTHGGRTPFTGKPETHRPRYLIVVSREQPDLWRHLRQLFTGIAGVDIVLDRRHGGRWQWTQSRVYEERGDDRRRPRNLDAGLSHRSFVIVNPEEGAVTPPAT